MVKPDERIDGIPCGLANRPPSGRGLTNPLVVQALVLSHKLSQDASC